MFHTIAQPAAAASRIRHLHGPVILSSLRRSLTVLTLSTLLTGCGSFAAVSNPSGEPPVRQIHAWWSAYRPLDGPLFGAGGPSPYDVEQGEVGSCWLLAALASVAQQQPQMIRALFEAQPDGTYLVRFHEDPGQEGAEGVTNHPAVRITTMAPYGLCGGPRYARARHATWVALAEKAYAQRFAPDVGYEGIGGEHPHLALMRLTGWPVEDFDIDGNLSGATQDEEWEWLLATYRAGAPMVAGSRILQLRPEIAAMHAYAVTGVYEDATGRRLIRLFDPEGLNDHPNHELELALDELDDHFFYVSAARPVEQ